MSQKLMGFKRRMTQTFDKEGNVIVCTIIEVEPNVVTQVKSRERDGYEAMQLACGEIRADDQRTVARRAGKPRVGHFAKAGVAPRRHICEVPLPQGGLPALGQAYGVECLTQGMYVDVTGVSKGRGFQGVMKLHGFKGGPAAHGSGFHRHAGSTGMRSTPGRCLPGGKRAGRMGGRRKTVQTLQIIGVDAERGLVLVSGPIPGASGTLVVIAPAVKKSKVKA